MQVRRFVSRTWFSLLCLSGSAGACLASGPRASTSTVPASIRLVGSNAGEPDAAGTFMVVARDLTNGPVNGASVVVDFSGAPDLVLCSDPLDGAAQVNCGARTIRKFTNVQGEAAFTLLGGSSGIGGAASSQAAVKVYADGILLRTVSASAFDLDGSGGVAINDLGVWLGDLGSGQAWARSDFDGDGGVGINDLSVWLERFGAGTSAVGCTSSCP